jgi:RHH-type proline utilization regulon transcriptional repressor/proline dehydrogenase/delta 1-pyrroline-5-carboxylate dehydrogenase
MVSGDRRQSFMFKASSNGANSAAGEFDFAGAGPREQRLLHLGRQLLEQMELEQSLKERWFEKMLRPLLADPTLKVQALRFIDVLPALSDDGEVIRHLQEYLMADGIRLPRPLKWATRLASMNDRTAADLVRKFLTVVAGRYIVGADDQEALAAIESLRSKKIGFSLDLLGEAVLSEQEADQYQQRYLSLIEALPGRLQAWPTVPRLDRISGRPGPRLYLSLKLSSLYSQINTLDPEGSIAGIAQRLRPLLQAARRQGAFVCFDMEQYDYKEIVLGTFKTLLMEPALRDWPDAGIALQAYLRETEADLVELIEWARERGRPITVRLVRGAYWDYETVIARQAGWPSPVWDRKWQTDACYENCLGRLFEASPVVRPAVATHNPRTVALAMALAEEHQLGADEFEFQMLYGMVEPLQRAIAGLEHCLRIYLPCGEPIPGMAYLVRRFLENVSSQSLERLSLIRQGTPEQVLAPLRVPAEEAVAEVPQSVQPAAFHNEPVCRFTDSGQRICFADRIERARERLGAVHPLIIDGVPVDTGHYITSVNPARPEEIVGLVAAAGRGEADKALVGATQAFRAWSRRPASERASLLFRAAVLLREQRVDFAALEILEAGKTWREADADVAEAIDYLEFYAREALRLAQPDHRDVAGELNRHWHRPYGVGLILPPWNFPLAILVGMLSASIVTGNTALLKPSSLTPVLGARFVSLLQAAGAPPGVVQFLPGPGSEVGEYLVMHPGIHFIAFTGSREVGTRILNLAAQIAPGQRHIKRVIAEMGGKNAIIVDGDADLDEAVAGILHSAFGYQGQKCSACSRVIVVGPQYDRLLGRLTEAAHSLKIGDPADPGVFMGPVIDRTAKTRIERVIEAAGRHGELALRIDCSRLEPGCFVGPAIVSGVAPDSSLGQEEIFGPVLAMMRARSLDQALEIANATAYALTGGFYSRSPGNIEQVRREFAVGNLYINRKITGALVDRQPFGGFKLSGCGSKAGGNDYLRQFLIPCTFTEQTLRRGFAPESRA